MIFSLLIMFRKKSKIKKLSRNHQNFVFSCIFLCNAFAIQLRHCTLLCLVNLDGVFSAKKASTVSDSDDIVQRELPEKNDGGFACIFLS